jgi:hypothetical protein
MKIFSITSMSVFLLGVGAAMTATPAKAELPSSNCYKLAQECLWGNQQACQIYSYGCKGEAPEGAVLGGPASIKDNQMPYTAAVAN